MSKSIPASKAVHSSDASTRGHGLRGALVLLVAAVMLVAGTYYVVLTITGPDGWVSHMASAAQSDVEGRTMTVAAETY